MHLLPWNNPIVVTAFRVRYRRGGLFTTTVLYVALLAAAGMAWSYYVQVYDVRGTNPVLVYFMCLMALQLGVGVFLAGVRTAASMKNEVMNKTLDFQRTAALGP